MSTFVADKSGVDSLSLVPFLQSGDEEGTVMAALLESLRQMVSRNHRPSSCLLLRLTDGRVRIVASPDGLRQAREETLRIRNEYGPLSVAFSIEVTDGPSGVRFVVENLCRRHGDSHQVSSPVKNQSFAPAPDTW